MKITLLFALLFAASSAYSQELSEMDSARYFDFWVGEWTASWDEGDGVKEFGTNTITRDLDEKVIVEQFRILDGQNAGFKGTSISVFQPGLNRWKQAWADSQGGYFDFTGDFEGEKRIFKTSMVEQGDKKIRQRMVFYNIKADSMTWDWERTEDGGETWILSWRIFYKRKT